MKKVIFSFVFIFLLTVSPFEIIGGNINKNRLNEEDFKSFSNSKDTLSSYLLESLKIFSENWHIAEGSYYNPKDPKQTRKDTDGIGAFGRKIKSGSIAFGSIFTEKIRKEKIVVFIEIKDCNIITPYGKGIFRIDDKMANRYSKKDKYYIDFYHEDLDWFHKKMGRFKKEFRVHKILKTDEI